jgi:hypothetical protein
MPTQIIHLCTAKKSLDILQVNKISEFYFGCISVDSMYRLHTYYDLDGEGLHEKYLEAHLLDSAKGESEITKDFAEWKKTVRDFIVANKSRNNSDFYLGYGIHILTDIFWKETVLPKIKEAYIQRHGTEAKFRDVWYSEAERVEFDLYENFELKKSVFPYLADCPKMGGDLINADEADMYRESILHLFDGRINSHKPVEYFTYEKVTGFIKSFVEELPSMLRTHFLC